MTDPWNPRNQPQGRPQRPQGPSQYPQHPPQQPQRPPQGPPPGYAPPPGPPPEQRQAPPPQPEAPSPPKKPKRSLRDPLSIVLVLVIVVAVVAAALIGVELYARNRGETKVAAAVECLVEDKADVSFGFTPPFLMQHMSGHYTNIHIKTAGNQVKGLQGMQAEVTVKDVRLEDTADSGGTIGSLVAKIDWTAAGMSQSIQDAIPLVGSLISGVTTNPSDGTVELEAALGNIVTKPEVQNGALKLEVTELTGLGFTLPRETIQPALDSLTSQLTRELPMNIKADSVEVTDTGVETQFSTRNATIPKSEDNSCFSNL